MTRDFGTAIQGTPISGTRLMYGIKMTGMHAIGNSSTQVTEGGGG